MKITVTTPTGNIGRVLTEKLLAGDAEITLIARSAEKVAGFAERGARVIQGSLADAGLIQQATEHADTLFWLTPVDYTAEDFRAYQNSLGDLVTEAARSRSEMHVVHLSSMGAHLAEGTGPIKGLHDIEQKLNAATQRVTHLRPTYFMENVLPSLQTIAADGAIFSTIPAEVRLQQIATRDIAAPAAETLLGAAPASPRVVHLLGPEEISFARVASTVSEAIGKPVAHVVIEADQLRSAMLGMGISADVAAQLLELEDAITKGLAPPEGSTVRTTATTFAAFAREVVATAYRQAAGAASA